MNNKKFEELSKWIMTTSNNELISGKPKLNLSVEQKYRFSYPLLDLIKNSIEDEKKKYTIYFIMSCGKKEIIKYMIRKRHYIEIIYRDIYNKKEEKITVDLCRAMGINQKDLHKIIKFIEYEIAKSGSTFKMSIYPQSMEQIQKYYPDLYALFPEESQRDYFWGIEMDIYYMIENFGKINNLEEYDLLYIGKSNAENENYDIFNRLTFHKTIQKMTRERDMYYPNRELVVIIYSFRSKLFVKEEMKYNVNLVMGDSNWESLFNMKKNQEIILLLEAILINHFKPKYNSTYKEKISVDSEVYKVFRKKGIEVVSVELDLSLNNGGKIRLKTTNAYTITKLRNLTCYVRNGEIRIDFNDMPDVLYDVL